MHTPQDLSWAPHVWKHPVDPGILCPPHGTQTFHQVKNAHCTSQKPPSVMRTQVSFRLTMCSSTSQTWPWAPLSRVFPPLPRPVCGPGEAAVCRQTIHQRQLLFKVETVLLLFRNKFNLAFQKEIPARRALSLPAILSLIPGLLGAPCLYHVLFWENLGRQSVSPPFPGGEGGAGVPPQPCILTASIH